MSSGVADAYVGCFISPSHVPKHAIILNSDSRDGGQGCCISSDVRTCIHLCFILIFELPDSTSSVYAIGIITH